VIGLKGGNNASGEQPPRPSSMPEAAVNHISTAVWAPPGFLQWHEVALQWPECTQCTVQHHQQAQQCVQGTYCGGWRRCACLDAKTRVLAVGALASAACNNFIADLLFLSEVPHPLLVAGAPYVHPYLGKWALGAGGGRGAWLLLLLYKKPVSGRAIA
jgi:hypothetical protein